MRGIVGSFLTPKEDDNRDWSHDRIHDCRRVREKRVKKRSGSKGRYMREREREIGGQIGNWKI